MICGYTPRVTEPVVEVRIHLEDQASDAHAARRAMAEAIAASGSRVDSAETTLLVDELISNALRHGGGTMEVVVRIGPDSLWAEVRDENPVFPALRQPPPTGQQEGGRGLWLVNQLSTAWGTRRVGRGKAVWFESRATEAPPAQEEGGAERP
jgi:anti-sigma regulatory factor (Ser/Thr protein kinase)